MGVINKSFSTPTHTTHSLQHFGMYYPRFSENYWQKLASRYENKQTQGQWPSWMIWDYWQKKMQASKYWTDQKIYAQKVKNRVSMIRKDVRPVADPPCVNNLEPCVEKHLEGRANFVKKKRGKLIKAIISTNKSIELVYLWSKTHRDDSGDNHDDREDKTDDVHISFAVERTFGVLKINLLVW